MFRRKALMHVTGDKDNNITTGANRAFTDELIGYNLINGVYSLNNAGKDVAVSAGRQCLRRSIPGT